MSFIHQPRQERVIPEKILFIQYSGPKAHALQWGGSRLYIAFERRKP